MASGKMDICDNCIQLCPLKSELCKLLLRKMTYSQYSRPLQKPHFEAWWVDAAGWAPGASCDTKMPTSPRKESEKLGAPGCEHGSTMESPVCWGIIGPTLGSRVTTDGGDWHPKLRLRDFKICAFLCCHKDGVDTATINNITNSAPHHFCSGYIMSCYLAPTSVIKYGHKRPVLQALPTNYNQSCATMAQHIYQLSHPRFRLERWRDSPYIHHIKNSTNPSYFPIILTAIQIWAGSERQQQHRYIYPHLSHSFTCSIWIWVKSL
jgi:hypothetical protein